LVVKRRGKGKDMVFCSEREGSEESDYSVVLVFFGGYFGA
jgi:hypothetical protein